MEVYVTMATQCVCNHGYRCIPQILTFKEISWQMIRIEADAIQSAQNEMLSAPIRLITNQSKISCPH